MAKVSIVIPCFNSGALVTEAADSAMNQSYSDIEVVVVDDGSTDPATLVALESLEARGIKIIRQPNRGPAAARNAGIHEASGTYILPLDADDRIHSTYTEKAFEVLSSDTSIGAVYCKAEMFGARAGVWNLPNFSVHEMAIDNVVFCSALFRKSDWKRVGGYSEGLRHGVEDYDFWLKFLSAGLRITQLDETLFFYRVQPSSRTSRFLSDENKMIDTYARIFRNHLQFYSTHAETLFRHRFQLYRDKESLVKEIEEIRPFAIELHHQNTKLREQISALQHDGSIRRTAVQLLKLTLRRISPRLCTLVRDWYRAIRVRGASIMSAH